MDFKETEEKLKNYYRKDKLLNSYMGKIELLKKQIKFIDEKIKNTNIIIPEESRSISYEERVQTSSDGCSYAEKMAIKIIDDLIREKAYKIKEINDTETKIRKIEADNKIIDDNIKEMEEEYKRFIEFKYRDEKNNREIALKLHKSESGISRIKKLALNIVESWEKTLTYNVI